MESSFEYRDNTGVESESDTEIIDDSLVEENSFTAKTKTKLTTKNETVFVAESEESTDDDTEEYEVPRNTSKLSKNTSYAESQVISSSEDDVSKKGSIRRESNISNKFVASSSDEGELSPEIILKRRPPTRPKSIESDSSFIGRKVKKRIMLIDSDTENSIIIEHDRHKKMTCVKATPLKITTNKNGIISDDDGTECDTDESNENVPNDSKLQSDNSHQGDDNEQNSDIAEDDDENCQEEEDEVDEDQMVMSRATRMSIMGIIPKDDDSDESDIIQSDDSNIKSRTTSLNSNGSTNYADLPDISVAMNKTPAKVIEDEPDSDSSRITCSPFGSPSNEVTVETYESPIKNQPKVLTNKNNSLRVSLMNRSLKDFEPKDLKNGVDNKDKVFDVDDNKENKVDDDVIICDNNTEIIALSSDDEDEVVVKKPVAKKSPSVRRSHKPKEVKDEVDFTPYSNENTIKQYLAPKSYPNQIVYVKKHVKENELNKLNSLKEDLQSIRYLLENMDMDNLPDGGAKLVERLSGLEAQVRAQGDKVANMVVEPEKPSAEEIARDGFDKGLSWDDIKKASNAVQPRMFGKQAISTHMAERNLILDRLRDLYESLGSRPPESEEGVQPKSLTSKLMQHQLHALAWLTWRETQNPAGGILADDMGLGKTITMIALIAAEKENKIDHGDDDDDEMGNAKLARGGSLVVCPASLLQQWAGEVRAHCGRGALSVCAHHGAARTQHAHRLAQHDIVITTYHILLRDHEKNGVLTRVLWRRVILDEAHAVRNYKSATSLSVCGLRSRRRWCLTGTPVQNKDLDLFALLKFLRCTPFDDLTMWKKWIDNKSMGGQERLSTIMRCILLRRTKQQLQQKGQLNCLPKRDTHMCEVTLTKEEMNVYQKVLVFSKTLFAQFLHQRAEKSADQMGTPTDGKDSAYYSMHKKMIALQGAKPVRSHEILVLLLRLRQVCCHCGLIAAMLDPELAANEPDEQSAQTDLLDELNKLSIREHQADKNKVDEEEGVEEEGTSVAEAIRSVLSPNNPVFKMDRNSSKIKAVMDCLEKNVLNVPGEKAVVVSQWTSVLGLVSSCLRARRAARVTLHGGVPARARQALVDLINDPQSEVKVMLLSLCAGGVGLNLCGANHLLLLDPHWNPQLEEQAQDRIYRVGQTKHVHIYRFMCVDTVEQSIRKLQLAKLELADNVLTGARNNASKLTIEDLKMLFNMGT